MLTAVLAVVMPETGFTPARSVAAVRTRPSAAARYVIAAVFVLALGSEGWGRLGPAQLLAFPQVGVVTIGALGAASMLGAAGLTELLRRNLDGPRAGRLLLAVECVRLPMIAGFALAGSLELAAATWLLAGLLRSAAAPLLETWLVAVTEPAPGPPCCRWSGRPTRPGRSWAARRSACSAAARPCRWRCWRAPWSACPPWACCAGPARGCPRPSGPDGRNSAMTIPWDLGPAAEQVATLADGVTEDRLGDPTPCPGWSVATVLVHFIELTDAFTDGARKKVRTDTPEPTPDLPPQWRPLLRSRLDALVQAWRDPAAWAGEATVAGVTLPADLTAAVVTDELVVHGWDLARALGAPFAADPAAVRGALVFAKKFSGMEGGPFGPPVPVPPDASDFDQLLGYAGRDQDWTP
ncbi:MAG TPA: TIGR03086 family metal-binding protein [Mycobacteriales bacterium]